MHTKWICRPTRACAIIVAANWPRRSWSSKKKKNQETYKGPNFCWHIDSYDKLKPYGICINDGYSHLLIWLKALSTSSDPKGNYFTDSVSAKKGCLARFRADLGTENGHVCQMQNSMRWDHLDQFAKKSFIYGSSNHNQRIECWWSFLRTHQSQYWVDFVSKPKGQWPVHRRLFRQVQFVSMNLIQVSKSTDNYWKLL